MKFVMSSYINDSKNNNMANVIHEQNIKSERKGLLISMMQALNNNSIKLNNENERLEIMENLKNSYKKISTSPKLKIDSYKEPNPNSVSNSNSNNNIKQNVNLNLRVIDKDNSPFPEKGKKHFSYHPSLESNVNLNFKDKYDNSRERIDQMLNYYKEIGEKERKYHFSPQIYSLYNKEQTDPLQKYSEKVRAMNLSKENPNYVLEKPPNEYVVYKFNSNLNANGIIPNKIGHGRHNSVRGSQKQQKEKENFKSSNMIQESYNQMRKKEADNNRIKNLKKGLEAKNFYEVKNTTLKNLKDESDFDIIQDIQKKLEIKNDYENLTNLANNKNSTSNNQIENFIEHNNLHIINNNPGRRARNTKNEDESQNNFMLKVNQLNYIPESRNLNNNSNNMLNIFNSNTDSRITNNYNKLGKKIDYENIRNKKVNISYNHEENMDPTNNNMYGEKIVDNKKNNNMTGLGVTRLRMMDPLEKLKLLNEMNSQKDNGRASRKDIKNSRIRVKNESQVTKKHWSAC